MSEEFKKSSAMILKLADHISHEQFEDKFHDLKDTWAFDDCIINGFIHLNDSRVRIDYSFRSFSEKPEAIEEVQNFAEACGIAIQGRKYEIE
jgi:hypothetical protein